MGNTATGNISVNDSEGMFECADRTSPGHTPKDITAIKHLYLPLDALNKFRHTRRTIFGATIFDVIVQPGKVYPAFDGKRLVLEVGCKTVIYILINPSKPNQHHRLFIESEEGFNHDITMRLEAKLIAQKTRMVETIVKYEMYFIMGVISTTGLPAWLAITGADVTFIFSKNKPKVDAAKKLSSALLKEFSEIEEYAPTLYSKVSELVSSELYGNLGRTAKQLPTTVVNDEKVQAQVSGILFGKASNVTFSGRFTAWTLITTLLSQAVIKSMTKSADAFKTVIDHRYKPLIEDLKKLNPKMPATYSAPALKITKLISDNGIHITQQETLSILKELTSNADKAYKNLTAIAKALTEFNKTMSTN